MTHRAPSLTMARNFKLMTLIFTVALVIMSCILSVTPSYAAFEEDNTHEAVVDAVKSVAVGTDAINSGTAATGAVASAGTTAAAAAVGAAGLTGTAIGAAVVAAAPAVAVSATVYAGYRAIKWLCTH